MVDTLTCEVAVPGQGAPERLSFSTKDLFCYGGHFTITREGRLVERVGSREMEGRRDLDYHGDIRFCAGGAGVELLEYVARFTHGKLEWLRSVSELPEAYLRILRLRN